MHALLEALKRKYARFEWGPPQIAAFKELKALQVSEQVVAHPQLDKPYKLYTDA